MLDMLTTTPGRDSVASMSATVSRTTNVAPVRFTSRTARQSSAVIFLISPVVRSFFTSIPSRMIPALFTRALSPPIASRAQATNSVTSPSRRTSSLRLWMPAGSSASAASSMSPAATCAPGFRETRAKCAPIPRAAPVTIAFTSFSCMFPSLCRRRGAP